MFREFPSRPNMVVVYIFIINVMLSFFVIGQNPETELRLRKNLFSKHSKGIRPVSNISLPVEINATLELLAINEFDTIKGILATQCSLELRWYDEFLSWDPRQYANISMLYVSAKEIWRPDFIVCNSVAAQFIDNEANNLVLHSDGRVLLWYQELLRTFCTIHAHGYPFDEQRCHIYICVAIHKVDHTVLRRLYYHKAPFFKNFQWDVDMEGIGATGENGGRSMTEATVFLTRKINISTFAMMVPSAIFTVVSVFVFLLPAESGEKVSLATTLFLSVIVYLIEIDKLTPKNSESSPLISLYLLMLAALSGLNTIGAIIECRVYILHKRKSDMKNHSIPSDGNGVKAASKKNKVQPTSTIDQDHNKNVENKMDGGLPDKDLGKGRQPETDDNYNQQKPRHQLLGNIFFGIGVMYIITSIITICVTKVFFKEEGFAGSVCIGIWDMGFAPTPYYAQI